MSYESIIIASVVGNTGNPSPALPCMLLNLDGSVVSSGNTNNNGLATFTGIAAGVYDIKVVGASGNYVMNYELKNSYMVPIGESSFAFESRAFVRSGEVVDSPGILTQNKVNILGIQTSGSGVNVTTIYREPFDNSLVTGISNMNKQFIGLPSGNAYYHLNQNLTNVQRVRLSIGE